MGSPERAPRSESVAGAALEMRELSEFVLHKFKITARFGCNLETVKGLWRRGKQSSCLDFYVLRLRALPCQALGETRCVCAPMALMPAGPERYYTSANYSQMGGY